MNSFAKLGLFFGLALVGSLSIRGAVVNDGTSTNTLVKVSGSLGSDAGTANLNVDANGSLLATQTGDSFPSLRSVWYAAAGFATSGVYAVSADFWPAEDSDERRGGVMGWLNLSTSKGISFHVRPGTFSPSFQVSVVNFLTSNTGDYESVTNLFNLDGSAATESYGSAWSDLGTNYVATRFATFQLTFAAPSAADRAALSNVTAHVAAKVFQGTNISGAPRQVGQTVELLTDLPLPAPNDHRFGYYAVFGTFLFDGPIGYLDNLTAEGEVTVLTNLPPTINITSPTNGASFTEPATIDLQVNATDSDGTVTRVDFFSGSSLIGSVTNITNSTLTFTWSNVPAGNYSLTARATDDKGATNTSGAVNITVNMSGGTGPTMIIVRTGTAIEIFWPAPGYQLQMSTNLLTNSWSNVPNTLSTNRVVLTNVTGNAFFRLRQDSTPTAPTLSIQLSGNTVTVSWPPAAGYRLQSTTSLGPPTWADVQTPGSPFSESALGPTKFYRLNSGP